MNTLSTLHCEHARFELRFSHLFRPGRGYSFPCDARGCVDLDGLSDSLRDNYLFARALVGHELAAPVTCASPACVVEDA